MIEERIIEYLSGALSVPVSGDVPISPPESFVTVEKTGSDETDHLLFATLAVQSWGATRAQALRLNGLVKAAMYEAVALDDIARVHCQTDYNFTDTTTKHARYQAVFEVVFYA